MIFIIVNTFLMCLEHYDQPKSFENALTGLNYGFIGLFTIEFIMKFFALNFKYFKTGMNVFDFIVLLLSIIGVLLENIGKNYQITFIRVLRLARFGRVLRLFSSTKGIRSILFAITRSFTALINIGLLLFLVIFIYAIFGMNLFMNVAYSDYVLTKEFNFENIYRSIITLFPLVMTGGSNELLDALSNDDDSCDPNKNTTMYQLTKGDCGNRHLAIPFYVSFVVVTCFIIINMYTAIILDSFKEATEEVDEGLSDDDFELYCHVWQRFDPDNTEYIRYDQLSDFVDSLYETKTINFCRLDEDDEEEKILYKSPLRIPKPNDDKLRSLNFTLYDKNLVHYQDVLEALIKICLGYNQTFDPSNDKSPLSSTSKSIAPIERV